MRVCDDSCVAHTKDKQCIYNHQQSWPWPFLAKLNLNGGKSKVMVSSHSLLASKQCGQYMETKNKDGFKVAPRAFRSEYVFLLLILLLAAS
jgi:hypothetical protein